MHINWRYLQIYLLNFLRDPRLSLCSLASENLVSWGQELWCDPRECPSHSRRDSRRQLSSPKLVWKRSATLGSGSFFKWKQMCVSIVSNSGSKGRGCDRSYREQKTNGFVRNLATGPCSRLSKSKRSGSVMSSDMTCYQRYSKATWRNRERLW